MPATRSGFASPPPDPEQMPEAIRTDIPARLDRLPWGRFHTLVVIALGVTWILDGLEVTLAGSVAGALHDSPSLAMSAGLIGLSASVYLAGAVLGALGFGWMTDRLGRKRLFFITLAVYISATCATAFSWNVWSFMLFRFLTGAGIGGEYTAINSTIQELIPARVRGWVDLAINGSFWVGAMLGAAASLVLLDVRIIDPELGWRLAFFVGGALGLVILLLRAWLPESPRWLIIRGREAEAEKIVTAIEQRIARQGLSIAPPPASPLVIQPSTHTPLRVVLRSLFIDNRRRSMLGLTLMGAQAFFYNAIFFTYALVLMQFYQVPSAHIGWYIFPFALGNFLGPLLLGRFFDTIGRRFMITLTYALSGVLLLVTGLLFRMDLLSATTQTACWSVTFFFASCAAGSAYLTVSESFPLEIRALAIAIFYALGTALGGLAAPALFGWLIETGSRAAVLNGYILGATLMLVASIAACCFGLNAERKSLEEVARPLGAADGATHSAGALLTPARLEATHGA